MFHSEVSQNTQPLCLHMAHDSLFSNLSAIRVLRLVVAIRPYHAASPFRLEHLQWKLMRLRGCLLSVLDSLPAHEKGSVTNMRTRCVHPFFSSRSYARR